VKAGKDLEQAKTLSQVNAARGKIRITEGAVNTKLAAAIAANPSITKDSNLVQKVLVVDKRMKQLASTSDPAEARRLVGKLESESSEAVNQVESADAKIQPAAKEARAMLGEVEVHGNNGAVVSALSKWDKTVAGTNSAKKALEDVVVALETSKKNTAVLVLQTAVKADAATKDLNDAKVEAAAEKEISNMLPARLEAVVKPQPEANKSAQMSAATTAVTQAASRLSKARTIEAQAAAHRDLELANEQEKIAIAERLLSLAAGTSEASKPVSASPSMKLEDPQKAAAQTVTEEHHEPKAKSGSAEAVKQVESAVADVVKAGEVLAQAKTPQEVNAARREIQDASKAVNTKMEAAAAANPSMTKDSNLVKQALDVDKRIKQLASTSDPVEAGRLVGKLEDAQQKVTQTVTDEPKAKSEIQPPAT